MSEGLTFPQSPSDGETISFSFQHTGGDANNAVVTKTWSWNASKNAWISNSGGVVGSDRFVLKAGDTMSGDLTTTRAFRASGAVFSSNEFVTKSYVDAELAGFNPSGNYVLRTGDQMSGTLTGTSASFSNSITAPSGFIGTLTGNYIDIPSLGDFGSRIRVASDQSLGMPYYSGSMNSLNLWSRLHLIGGGGITGYSLRITSSTLGSLKDVEGRMIFDQGFTHGVAICSYGLENIDDQIAGLSIFGTNLYTGANNQSDQTMPYQGKTASNYSGMLQLGLDGRGFIPRMFSTRRTDLENTFDSNEFTTRQFFTDNEYRLSRDIEGDNKIKHFNLYLTYQKGGVTGAYQSWAPSDPWAKSINIEVGQGTQDYYNVNGHNYESEYHDLTEEKVGFPKPWAVHVKKSFWRSSLQQNQLPANRDGPRYYAPHGPRASGAGNPGFHVCDSRSFQTERDIRIRHIGFKKTADRGGPDVNNPAYTPDIEQYISNPAIGVDFPAVGASDGGYARIKLSTFIQGGYPILLGDVFINEINIVPG